LNCAEQLNKLGDTSAKEVKSTEDLIWRELKLFALWHVHKTFFCEFVLLQIRFVEVDASLKNWNELFWWILIMIPKGIIRW
jgi:hypothetical protein